MPDTLKQVFDSGPIRLAITAFLVGVAWANLHAENVYTELKHDAQLAAIRTELHTIQVLVCRGTPKDSMCAAEAKP